jgi:hypothetical protein
MSYAVPWAMPCHTSNAIHHYHQAIKQVHAKQDKTSPPKHRHTDSNCYNFSKAKPISINLASYFSIFYGLQTGLLMNGIDKVSKKLIAKKMQILGFFGHFRPQPFLISINSIDM